MEMCFPMLFNHRAKHKMPFWSSETENILKTPNILRKQCRCMWGKCEERLFPENFLGFGILQHTRAAVEHWFSCLEKLVTNEYKNYRLLGVLFTREKAGFDVRKQREQSAFGEGEQTVGNAFCCPGAPAPFQNSRNGSHWGGLGKAELPG